MSQPEPRIPSIPVGPIDFCPNGFADDERQREVLLDALAAAGVELGAYDERIVFWLAKWEWSTVAVIVSWLGRAGRGGDG